jgi:glycosyltransferase involved in cell wall biosynthesis
MSDTPPHLLLSTIDAQLSRRSGYHLLAEYMPHAERITAPRRDATGWRWLAIGTARRLAFTSWYLAGCAEMEYAAWRRIRRGFDGVVHFLWCDRDLGFLDRVLDPRHHRLVATFHNCTDTLRAIIRHPRRLRHAAAIILMSETQRAFFRDAGIPNDRIHFIPHGVDTEFFCPPAARDSGKFIALAVGGYRRNFTLLREICESLPEVRFEIVGPPAVAPKFHGLRNTRFSSGLNDVELLAKYQEASCLLHLAEQATANNVLLEALACGLPVISEPVGGIPEYVNDQCAMLGDPRASLRRLAESPALRAQMSAAARTRAGELAWPGIAARTLELYRSLA